MLARPSLACQPAVAPGKYSPMENTYIGVSHASKTFGVLGIIHLHHGNTWSRFCEQLLISHTTDCVDADAFAPGLSALIEPSFIGSIWDTAA